MPECWRRNLVLLLLLFMVAGCGSPESSQKTSGVVSADALIIDVRTQQEYDAGHVTAAILIPYDVIGDRIGEVTTNKQQQIIVYCRSGRRSGIAQRTLREMGFLHVENAGGLAAARTRLESTTAGDADDITQP